MSFTVTGICSSLLQSYTLVSFLIRLLSFKGKRKAGVFFTYNNNYLNFVRLQRMLYLEALPQSSLKEAKLHRYLETKHVKYVDENHSFLKSKELRVKQTLIDRPAI